MEKGITNQRTRDPDASRKQILDSAEALFAESGFDGTSIHDISRQAGVSRGTPGYFFGSKEKLYRAVLERAFAGPRDLVAHIGSQIQQARLSPEEALAAAVGAYFDYLVDHPSFIRLVQWESLSGGDHLGELPAHVASLEEGMGALTESLDRDEAAPIDAAHLLIDMIALCWFPLAHAGTLLRGLGKDVNDPAFRAERKQHIVAVLLADLHNREAHVS